jgi:hypothetical protein
MSIKRILHSAVIAALAAGLAVGCGGDADPPPDAGVQPGTDAGVDPGDAGTDAGTDPQDPLIDFRGDFQFPGNWDDVPTAEVVAFYPAQASWQWLNSPGHAGGVAMGTGIGCLTCHGPGAPAGDAKQLGTQLVAHATLEPAPIPDKEPWKEIRVQAAYDAENIYMRLRWASESPGIRHYLIRYDGTDWAQFGGPKPDVTALGQPPSYEDRVTLIVDDDNVPARDGMTAGFQQFGCFITCHNAMRAMPQEPTTAAAQAAIGRPDVRKYLLITRDPALQTEADGAWADMKSEAEIEGLFTAGQFLDLWQWRGARSAPVRYAGDDYVLEYRNFDRTGQNPFANNFAAGVPVSFMYDDARVGFNAIPLAELDQRAPQFPLIRDETAIPFDATRTFQVDDIISRHVVQVPTESRADVRAYSSWDNGEWTVTLVRQLDTGRPDDKALVDGQVYTIGLGLFDDHVSNRRHHVTFPLRLGLNVAAGTDVNAVRLP